VFLADISLRTVGLVKIKECRNDPDPFQPRDMQLASCPGLQLATPHRTVLQAGDVLFVPSGWPHAVRNISAPTTAENEASQHGSSVTVALSANYVDSSNIAQHIEELRWQAMAEAEDGGEGGRSKVLLSALSTLDTSQ
jgi:hypothetical protein